MAVVSGQNSTIKIKADWCKKCGVCQALCPKKVLGSDELGRVLVLAPDQCIACRICERICPDFAISVEVKEDE